MKERHYFTDNTDLPSHRKEISYSIGEKTWTFVTDDGVFSKDEVDTGTRVLLKAACAEDLSGNVLDMGCGYGVIAVTVKSMFPKTQVTAADINPRAVSLAAENADRNHAEISVLESDGFAGIEGQYHVILTNPPIRAGKQVIYAMFRDAYAHLGPGGILLVVIRRKQGAESAVKFLADQFGACSVVLREKGYWVLKCMKQALTA
jgi:16S rRNA (guanine1207-N2)-methyltransferase